MKAAVIVAAGKGVRMGGTIPKVLLPMRGKTVLWYAVRAFAEAGFEQIVLVTPRTCEQMYADACLPYKVTAVGGGQTRMDSVWRGLQAVKEEAEWVAIHDGARPCITVQQIQQILEDAKEWGAAIAGTQARDTIQQTDGTPFVLKTPDRDCLWNVQTPQIFERELLMKAYEKAVQSGKSYTDDASVVLELGVAVRLTDTGVGNFKVTSPEDVAIIAARLNSLYGERVLRIGTGYDVHRLVENRRLVLCGVPIPFELGLLGHSDADVAAHAVMDALLGAAALGDIGQLFPDHDPAYEGADSMQLMHQTIQYMKERGFAPAQVDVTLICQRPKLLPYRQAMRENLARALSISLSDVSVKATTTEQLGFEGRGEGISAQAVATVWTGETSP